MKKLYSVILLMLNSEQHLLCNHSTKSAILLEKRHRYTLEWKWILSQGVFSLFSIISRTNLLTHYEHENKSPRNWRKLCIDFWLRGWLSNLMIAKGCLLVELNESPECMWHIILMLLSSQWQLYRIDTARHVISVEWWTSLT